MASPPTNDSATSSPDPGLPPVQPPSGRFIVQLFVVPAAIILVVVVVIVLSYGGLSIIGIGKRDQSPEYFLKLLDNDNPDIRWRGASDLAQILKRPEAAAQRWKADPTFALELAQRLDAANKNLLEDEKSIAAEIARSTDADKDLLWRKLRPQRDYVSFLMNALGDFHIPVGAPILCTILKNDTSPDLKGNTLQRRKALWALMNMGDNLKGFAKVPAEQRQPMFAALKEEAGKSGPRAGWARTGLWYLDKTGSPQDVVKVDETLVACHQAEDRFLRTLIAMAFNFWDGEDAEATLLTLANDAGRGTLIRVAEND